MAAWTTTLPCVTVPAARRSSRPSRTGSGQGPQRRLVAALPVGHHPLRQVLEPVDAQARGRKQAAVAGGGLQVGDRPAAAQRLQDQLPLQRGGPLRPAPVDQQQAPSWSQPGRDLAQRRPPVGQVAGRVQADRGVERRLGKLVEVHDVVLDELQIRAAPARNPAAGVGELAARQVDADHHRGGAVGQPRRQATTAAGHVQDAAGRGPPIASR